MQVVYKEMTRDGASTLAEGNLIGGKQFKQVTSYTKAEDKNILYLRKFVQIIRNTNEGPAFIAELAARAA